MQDISSFGVSVQLRASNTFPQGFNITQFSDDSDPVDGASIQIADKAMGANGDLIVWSKANPLLMTIAVIPNSDDDKNLSVLAEANRTAKGKRPARDVITATVMYPDGTSTTLTQGKVTDAMPYNSPSSSGRFKTKVYAFAFENKTDGN